MLNDPNAEHEPDEIDEQVDEFDNDPEADTKPVDVPPIAPPAEPYPGKIGYDF